MEAFTRPVLGPLDRDFLVVLDEIADRLVARRHRWGFSYFTVLQEVAENFAPVVARLAGIRRQDPHAAVLHASGQYPRTIRRVPQE